MASTDLFLILGTVLLAQDVPKNTRMTLGLISFAIYTYLVYFT
jgi:hypothetical protein